MELQLTHPYQVGIGRVLGAFFDKDHILEKNEFLGSRNVRVAELKKDDASAKLVVERQMTTSVEVPGMLSHFHREWNQVRQEEHWFRKSDCEWHCEFRVHIEDVPAKIKGVMRLEGTEEACTNHVTLNVRCDIPLLGKKISAFLREDSKVKMEREYETILQLL
ncbi:DUF2505 domain-containing protein [Marinobacter salexigens]|uniref:DUF2505 domain-containing protein n=1 Tax=Marinobacter salexigens TaxID=1925763 RepID=A0ABS6A5X9_9GAMM|nr:DUF2505 domain-containing protein [Marinobacter salexigens]MBU2873618.1 DUF2505 domain-containing protein [Marinobacter salexigens]